MVSSSWMRNHGNVVATLPLIRIFRFALFARKQFVATMTFSELTG